MNNFFNKFLEGILNSNIKKLPELKSKLKTTRSKPKNIISSFYKHYSIKKEYKIIIKF